MKARLIPALVMLSAVLVLGGPMPNASAQAAMVVDGPAPAIHGPLVVGASPRRPFLLLVPATGTAPLTYSCPDLPPGLTLDAATGIITGAVTASGTYTLHLSVRNGVGKAGRDLTLVCGDGKRALTPTLGWNSWNVYGDSVTDADIRTTADWLVKTGLAGHGYSQINIDDAWQGGRNPKTGEILTNHHRFPDMKALADYVHAKGLKLGLSSAPTEHTCAGYAGSLGHTSQDAATYAAWGIDYLKYSWCPVFIDENKPPADVAANFKLMGDALNGSGRDIVFAVNTFGRFYPWNWVYWVDANSWETSQSLYDGWDVLQKALLPDPWLTDKAAPGHFSNTGLLQVGRLGYPGIHWSHLSAAEQQAQVTMDSLLACPLIMSCDLTQLDPNAFHRSTFALLANDEVLAVDQDPRGVPAVSFGAQNSAHARVWSRPLADGTTAVGLFNHDDEPAWITVKWADFHLPPHQPVRDLWQRQDLGVMDQYTTELPPHSAVLFKVGVPGAVKLR